MKYPKVWPLFLNFRYITAKFSLSENIGTLRYMKGAGMLFFLLSACCYVCSLAAPFVFQICWGGLN